MNTNYTKALLLTYPHIETLMAQIDDLVERKALAAFTDFSPCEEIAEKILTYTAQKDVLIKVKTTLDEIFAKLTEDEFDLLDYKYLKTKPKKYYIDFDYTSRSYFRKQTKLAEKIYSMLKVRGMDEQWFEEECLSTDFFKRMYKRIVMHEKNMNKNKSKKKVLAKEKKPCENIHAQKLKLSA